MPNKSLTQLTLERHIRDAATLLKAGRTVSAIKLIARCEKLGLSKKALEQLKEARLVALNDRPRAAATLLSLAKASAQVRTTRAKSKNESRACDAAEMLSLVPDAEALSPGEQLRDALANLLHWCDREKEDFESALRMARMHHEAEQ